MLNYDLMALLYNKCYDCAEGHEELQGKFATTELKDATGAARRIIKPETAAFRASFTQAAAAAASAAMVKSQAAVSVHQNLLLISCQTVRLIYIIEEGGRSAHDLRRSCCVGNCGGTFAGQEDKEG